MMQLPRKSFALMAIAGILCTAGASAQSTSQPKPAQTPASPQKPVNPPPSGTVKPPANVPVGVTTPADYRIGIDDVLAIVFWREQNMNADVVVRPDGKITLPLINEIDAVGLTTEELRARVVAAAGRFVTDPNATVVVKQINSRKIFVTGEVGRPGSFPLSDSMTVIQALAMAGGLREFADASAIIVMRNEGGQPKSFKVNYKDIRKGKNLQQNILLKPGDTIVVP
jgi:polysaccharide export outer membrane protein